MMRHSWLAIVVLLAASLPVGGRAQESLAVSGNGQVLVTGGNNRVVYFLDPQTLKVTQRVRVNQQIHGLALSADGSLLAVAEGVFDNVLTFRETKTGKVTRTVEKVSNIGGFGNGRQVFAQGVAADLLAFRTGDKLQVVSLKDASDVATVTLPKEPAYLAAVSADGKKLAVITQQVANEEKKDEAAPDEKTAKDPQWQMHHDGKGSVVYTYELPSGNQLSRMSLWYSADAHMSAVAGYAGDDLLVLTYGNQNARIKPDGTVESFKHCDSYGYGLGIAPDGSKIAAGSMLKGGVVIDLPAKASTPIKGAAEVPGWPEYFSTLAFDAQGTLFGLTSSLRIFRLAADGTMAPIEPVY